jgi:hypothetical protein
MDVMKEAHHGGFLYVGPRLLKGQEITDDRRSKRMLRDGFLAGTEELIACAGCLFEHPDFK